MIKVFGPTVSKLIDRKFSVRAVHETVVVFTLYSQGSPMKRAFLINRPENNT